MIDFVVRCRRCAARVAHDDGTGERQPRSRLEPQVNHALSTIDSVARETADDLKKRMTELRIRPKT